VRGLQRYITPSRTIHQFLVQDKTQPQYTDIFQRTDIQKSCHKDVTKDDKTSRIYI